jgi:5,10-methylenetetrahydrofolate reductase
MLTLRNGWLNIVEVQPPKLPDQTHRRLDRRWDHVLLTDNVFGEIRVSPYAYGARITHDVPSVHPTVVVSTRDRNILAIESEVRGAIGNGVDSFLIVVGDTVPTVDHFAHHYEIVEHLRTLQEAMPPFEVGMPTRFREWMFRKRVDLGAQFFLVGPVLDPSVVEENMERLGRHDGDPPVYMAIIPPFSKPWIDRAEGFGAVPASDGLKAAIDAMPKPERRAFAWGQARDAARAARTAGCAGVVLMGLKFGTVVGEAIEEWFGARGLDSSTVSSARAR